jgi:hypothetical protein
LVSPSGFLAIIHVSVLIYFIENLDFSEKTKFFLSEKAAWDLVLQIFHHDGAVLERNNC